MASITTEAKVGIFVILGFLILIYMTATVGKWSLGREKGYLVTAKLDSASGLLKDSLVKVLGVRKGKVEKLEIIESKAKIYMRLPTKLVLPEDSLVYVKSEGLLGEKHIEIKPGSPDKPPVKHMGELLQGTPPADLDILFTELSEVAKGIKNLTRIITQPVGDAEGTGEKEGAIRSIIINLEKTSESLKNLSQSVEKGEGTLGKLFTDDAMYNELSATLSDISAAIKTFSSSEGTLGKLLSDEEVYNDIKEITTRINAIVRKIERGKGILGKLFTGEIIYKNQEEGQEGSDKASKDEEYVPLTALGSMLGTVTE
ncbi:MAG: MCE family protein [Deltaproteobacteria bacterium]|nr:MCE family protein [Deltaproteobacteria bacterium]